MVNIITIILLFLSKLLSTSSNSIRSPCAEIFQYGKESGKDVGFLEIGVPKTQIYNFNVTLVFNVASDAPLTDNSVKLTLMYNTSQVVRRVLSGNRVSYIVNFEGDALQLSQIYFSGKLVCGIDEVDQPTGDIKIITAFNEFKAGVEVVAEYNRLFKIDISEDKCGYLEKNVVEFSIGGQRAIKLNWPWIASIIDHALFTPVCLWAFYEDIENRPGTIVAFGETEFSDSGDINQLDLHAVSSDTCAKSHEKLASLVNFQTFCAKGPDGTGPCRGDSGGAFMIREGNKWYLRGVVSSGLENEYKECDAENYVVFMDVAKYVDWITNRKHTLKKEQDKPKQIDTRQPIIDSELDRKQQVFCYIGEWHLEITEKIRPGLCSMIYIWFASIDVNGTIQADNVRRLHNFLDLKPRYASKIILSLGGYADYTTKANMGIIAGSPTLRKAFAKSCLDVCKTYDLDGIDIHWEYPNLPDQEGYVEMAREAMKLLNPAGYLLTIGGPADKNRSGPQSGLRIKELSEVTNYINLITHDYHGDSSIHWSGGGLNINAPINAKDQDSVEDTLKRYIDQGVPPGKLTLGIPMYGRWWRLKDKNKITIGSPYIQGKQNDYAFAPAFHDYCRHLNDTSWTVVRPTLEVAPYMYRDRDWISFEDFQSVQDRVDLANKYNLAGVKIWSLEQDDYDNDCKYECEFPLMRTINNRLGRKIDCDFIDPNEKKEDIKEGHRKRTPIRDHELDRERQVFCYISLKENNNFTEYLQPNLCNFITLMSAEVNNDGQIIIKNEESML
uniref:CSON003228 protein n=1 Tax=Culicoides sonorensis TaxID=179676 RepID=A0A336M4R4_CULSO